MCGIIGVIGTPHAAQEAYQGLLLMQHRGQDAAGILSFDFNNQRYELHKKQGLVDQVFELEDLQKLQGQLALGHTRYSTIGGNDSRDLQPIILSYPFGLGLIHNGNIVNFNEIKENLNQNKKRFVFSRNDAEALINLIADGLDTYQSITKNNERGFNIDSLKFACSKLFEQAQGGYSVLGCVAGKGLYGFRDPNGIRPLILGERELTQEEKANTKSNKAYCLASESNTLNFLGYTVVRDIRPGELIFISEEGTFTSEVLIQNNLHKPCMFEWIYFANPESVIEEQNVYSTRLRMGNQLGNIVKQMMEEDVIDPDIIVPVPDTSRCAAIGLSEIVKRPYREVLIKNRYIQRSFILDTQDKRERAVKLKLAPVVSEIKGKKILLVDDSIVRGTTSRRIIKMLREAGAKEVYIASTCPPIYHPCFYGIDFPDPKELLATNKNANEIEQQVGADKVIYMDINSLKRSIGLPDMCMACLDGKYPIDISSAKSFLNNRPDKLEQVYESKL